MDYASLAGKYGGAVAAPTSTSKVDYSALASKYGATLATTETPKPVQPTSGPLGFNSAATGKGGLAASGLPTPKQIGQNIPGNQLIRDVGTSASGIYQGVKGGVQEATGNKTGASKSFGKYNAAVNKIQPGKDFGSGANLALSAATLAAPGLEQGASAAGKVGINAALGGGLFGAQDVATGKPASTVAKDTAIGTGLGVFAPPIAENLKEVFSPSVDKAGQKALQKVLDLTRDPVETKKETLNAFKSGGRSQEGALKTTTYAPTEDDLARAHAVLPYHQGAKTPEALNANIKAGIADISNTKLNPLYEKHAVPVQWNHINDFVKANANDPERVMNLPALKDKGASGITPKDIDDARKQLDSIITSEKSTKQFGTPDWEKVELSGRQDRNTLNKLSEEMVATGGNIEGLNNVNKTLAGVTERGIKVDSAGKADLENHFGVQRTPENILDSTKIRQARAQQSHLFDAQNNLARNTLEKSGKNALGRFKTNNPVTSKLIKKLPLIGAGAAAVDILKK